MVAEDGTINRKALGPIVFSSKVRMTFVGSTFDSLANGVCVHFVMVFKITWKPFWLATQLYPQSDWTGRQNGVKNGVSAHAPFGMQVPLSQLGLHTWQHVATRKAGSVKLNKLAPYRAHVEFLWECAKLRWTVPDCLTRQLLPSWTAVGRFFQTVFHILYAVCFIS